MRMKKNMKQLFRIFSGTFAVILLSMAAIAQSVVSGKITDSKDGSPLAGVTVTAKGTQSSTQTASDGTYKITVPATAGKLLFTSVGFGSMEVSIAGKSVVSLSLLQSNQQLNEVVVTGYGTIRKKDLTGVVSVVTAKDFQKGNMR